MERRTNNINDSIYSRIESIKKLIYINNPYTPSGKYSFKSIYIYSLFVILALLIGQILIAATEGFAALASFGWHNIHDNVQKWLAAISAIVIGYGFSGYLMGKIIDSAAKISKNRSVKLANVFGVITWILSFFLRVSITYFMSKQYDFGIKINSLKDLPGEYWILSSIGFFSLLIGIMWTNSKSIAINPFCEKCNNYMDKIYLYFKDNLVINILNNLKSSRENKYANLERISLTKSPEAAYPNIRFSKIECKSCHDGYINLDWTFYLDEKNNKQKNNLLVYSDNVSEESIKHINSFLESCK